MRRDPPGSSSRFPWATFGLGALVIVAGVYLASLAVEMVWFPDLGPVAHRIFPLGRLLSAMFLVAVLV
ncbi:MAG: hypothetical protein M3245_00680, partial [Actinomycetota bacterium]|nr:hypothetical protein [Actinomycetota bacterium]